MTTKTTHTPTPWKVAFPSGHIYEPATGFHVATMHPDILGFDARICEANAAHIVRCVNEREELIEVLRYAAALNWEVENKIHAILARAQQEG